MALIDVSSYLHAERCLLLWSFQLPWALLLLALGLWFFSFLHLLWPSLLFTLLYSLLVPPVDEGAAVCADVCGCHCWREELLLAFGG